MTRSADVTPGAPDPKPQTIDDPGNTEDMAEQPQDEMRDDEGRGLLSGPGRS
jgi:hypothetical protein